jgi:hypothetical protein
VSKRAWLLVGGALLLGAALVVPAAAGGTSTLAPHSPFGPSFLRRASVSVGPKAIPVYCAPGATEGRASIRVGIAPSPRNVGYSLQVTWTSAGTTVATATFTARSGGGLLTSASAPCPATHGSRLFGTVRTTWVKNGGPANDPFHRPSVVRVNSYRVGSAS